MPAHHACSFGRARVCPLATLICACFLNTGCAIMMAAKAPDKKDLSVLRPGVSRSAVVAELGEPHRSRVENDTTTDMYSFKQGYTDGTRSFRVGLHTAGDVLTLGLWELAGTPIELLSTGQDVRAEVIYDGSERAQRIEYFRGAYLADGGPTVPSWMSRGARQTAVLEGARRDSPGAIVPASATVVQEASASAAH